MKAAVIGIGSNSVRMLVGQVDGGTLTRLRRERAGTRLFAGLDGQGNLSASAMETTLAAVEEMAASARREGVDSLDLFATSATRDARNQAEFAARIRARTDLELQICSGNEEAALSFLGASDGGDTGVIDIGGGSTEIILGRGLDIRCAFSCQMGAVRLQRQLPITGHGDLPAVEGLAGDILEDKLREHPSLLMPESWRGTGGTFTSLAALVKDICWTDRTYMHGTALPLAAIEEQAWRLSDLTVEQRRKIVSLQPNRADIVVHGICILLAVMRRLNIPQVIVSEYGNLDGYLIRKYCMEDKK